MKFANLLEAMEAYNLDCGYILTGNESEEIEIGNFQVKVFSIWKWLLDLT